MIESGGEGRLPPNGSPPAYILADTQLARLGFVSDDERRALARIWVNAKSYQAGQDLIREGSSPDYLYLLTAGWACRYITTRSGGRQIPALIVPGGVCNLDNLLLDQADFGVRAITQVKVLALPRRQAVALAAEHPGVGRAFTWLAIAENAILSRWAVSLGRRTSQGRLAHLLCELSIRLGATGASECRFELPLTQELIADTLGLTPVHVNRTIQHLRTTGLIVTEGRMVTIPDVERLRALADFDPGYLHQIERSGAAA